MVTSVLAGCSSKEEIDAIKADIASIKTNLGTQQYAGLDPQLSFSFPEAKFSPPVDRFLTTPKLNYSMNVKQNNKSFPLNEYSVNAIAEIFDGAGVKRGDTIIFVTVENGSGSVAKMEDMYAVEFDNTKSLESYKIKIKNYSWYDSRQLKPFASAVNKDN